MDILKLVPVFVLILSSFGIPMPVVNAEDVTETFEGGKGKSSNDTNCLASMTPARDPNQTVLLENGIKFPQWTGQFFNISLFLRCLT